MIKLPDYIREFIGTAPTINLYPERKKASDVRYGAKCCESCGATKGVELEASRTQYHWDRKEDKVDPNRPIWLCRECAKDHHDHWDEMWAQYHAGLL